MASYPAVGALANPRTTLSSSPRVDVEGAGRDLLRQGGKLREVLPRADRALAAADDTRSGRSGFAMRLRQPTSADGANEVCSSAYLNNNRRHMRYDKALEKGWPIATGISEGASKFVIEDRFGITGNVEDLNLAA